MRYADARPQIKSGDLIAFTHRECKSFYDFKIQMVRMFSKSEYSHVGVAWVIGARVFLIEAVMPKVRIYPLSKCGDFFWLPMNAPWSDAAEDFALSKVGEDYSQLEAVLAYFNIKKPDNLWYCDEFARAVYEEDGVLLGEGMMPSGIVRAAQQRGSPLYFVEQ